MIRLSPARRAAEEFASVVDGPRGAVAERYADLLSTVDVLREQEIPAPRADFVADLRMQLMAARRAAKSSKVTVVRAIRVSASRRCAETAKSKALKRVTTAVTFRSMDALLVVRSSPRVPAMRAHRSAAMV